MREKIFAEFGGDRSGTAPLTWGQQAIWKSIESVRPNEHWLNVRRVIQLAPRRAVDVAAATRAVGTWVTRHETLRTRVRLVDGEPQQVLACEGRVPVEVVHVDEDAGAAPPRRLRDVYEVMTAAPALADATEDLLRVLHGVAFRYAEQWPVRIGLVVSAGLVRHVVIVLSHVAADWHCTDLLVRDLRLLLARGTAPAPAGLRPLDLARREQQDTRRTERALQIWQEAYRLLPPEPLRPVGPRVDPPYAKVVLTSPALQAATALISARHGVSTSTVLLAATAAMLAAHTGQDVCGLLTIVGNRFQTGHDAVLAPMNQLGLVVLDVAGTTPDRPDSLLRLLPRAWQAAMSVYRHAYYDQTVLDRALRAGGRGGDVHVDPYCCFNDVRGGAEPALPDVDAATLRAAPAGSTVEITPLEVFNWRFYLEVHQAADALGVAVSGDTRCLNPHQMERFLRDLERFVVEAAVIGVPPHREKVTTS